MNRPISTSVIALVAFCIGLSISFLTLPIWIVIAVNVAKDGNRTDWLGFGGAVIGALATLVAAGIALYAAYKTLKPVREQLDQLIKQNDHALHDRLRARATTLNNEEILLQQVASGCQLVDQSAREILDGRRTLNETAGFEVSVERLVGFVEKLQVHRGDVWGDSAAQNLRRNFVDLALGSGSTSLRLLNLMKYGAAAVESSQEWINWSRLLWEIFAVSEKLFQLVRIEQKRVGEAIAEAEKRLFGEHEVPT